MSLTFFNWVQVIKKADDLPSNAKYLALYLSTFMNSEQDVAWPSMRTIAGETAMSTTTVQKYISVLEQNGYIVRRSSTRHVGTKKGTQLHNEYLINIPEKVCREMVHLLEGVSSGEGRCVISEGKVCQEVTHNSPLNKPQNRPCAESTQNGSSRSPTVTSVVDLYHETLCPPLPRVEKMTKARRGAINQRIREDLTELENWECYFEYVKKSDFLMGRAPATKGRAPFRASLEWLTKASNFAKVSEEMYHYG